MFVLFPKAVIIQNPSPEPNVSLRSEDFLSFSRCDAPVKWTAEPLGLTAPFNHIFVENIVAWKVGRFIRQIFGKGDLKTEFFDDGGSFPIVLERERNIRPEISSVVCCRSRMVPHLCRGECLFDLDNGFFRVNEYKKSRSLRCHGGVSACLGGIGGNLGNSKLVYASFVKVVSGLPELDGRYTKNHCKNGYKYSGQRHNKLIVAVHKRNKFVEESANTLTEREKKGLKAFYIVVVYVGGMIAFIWWFWRRFK